MEQSFYFNVLDQIQNEEKKVDLLTGNAIDTSYRMITFLQNLLNEVRSLSFKKGFKTQEEEIYFFKNFLFTRVVFYSLLVHKQTTVYCSFMQIFFFCLSKFQINKLRITLIR